MQLQIQEIKKPEPISFNYEELKQELVTRTADYKTIVYTAENIKEAKADRANLNRLKKALNDERIRLEKEYFEPFADFKAKVNELCGIVDEASGAIDRQVKEFEECQKEKKYHDIEDLFHDAFSEAFPWLNLEQIWYDKWLNASVSMKQVGEAFKEFKEKIRTDLEMLGRLPEYAFEAQETYKQSLNVADAMQEVDKMKLLAAAKAKAEAEAKAKEKQPEILHISPDSGQVEIQMGKSSSETPEGKYVDSGASDRQWISFRALLDTDEAIRLNHFFKAENIKFEKI